MIKSVNKVSIIMPCYNVEQFVERSISTVFTQSFNNWELIIIDDCSTDNTKKIIDKFLLDERVIAIFSDKNHGASHSRNLGIDAASGEFIAFLDADDWWDENKLEEQIKLIKKFELNFVYNDYGIVDESGRFLYHLNCPSSFKSSYLKFMCPFSFSSILIEAKYVKDIKFRNIEARNDYDFYLRLFSKYPKIKLKKVCKHLSFYRINSKGISRNIVRNCQMFFNIHSFKKQSSFVLCTLFIFYITILLIKKSSPKIYNKLILKFFS